jgi:hypothetical protein
MSSTLNYEFEAIESSYVDKLISLRLRRHLQGLKLIAGEILLEGKETRSSFNIEEE